MVSDPMARDDRDVPDEELVVTFMDDLRARIAALEAENRALREFVAAADEWTKWCVCCMDEYESQFRPVMQRYDQERQRLAAEYGLPLPEVER